MVLGFCFDWFEWFGTLVNKTNINMFFESFEVSAFGPPST